MGNCCFPSKPANPSVNSPRKGQTPYSRVPEPVELTDKEKIAVLTIRVSGLSTRLDSKDRELLSLQTNLGAATKQLRSDFGQELPTLFNEKIAEIGLKKLPINFLLEPNL